MNDRFAPHVGRGDQLRLFLKADISREDRRSCLRQRTNPLAREGAGFEVGAYAAASIECVNDQG
jgi:hypothetical protein